MAFFFIKIQNFSNTKIHLKISSAIWQPFCPAGDELILRYTDPLSYDYHNAREGTLQSMGKYITWIYRLACCWVLFCFVYDQRKLCTTSYYIPDNKVHVANMGPTWVLSAPGGPHVGPMNLAIRDLIWDMTSWMPASEPYKKWGNMSYGSTNNYNHNYISLYITIYKG